MSQNLSSAAVVIGALWVKLSISARVMKTAVIILVLAGCLVTLNIKMGAEAFKRRYFAKFFELQNCCKKKGCPYMEGNCVPHINKGCYCLGDKEGLFD